MASKQAIAVLAWLLAFHGLGDLCIVHGYPEGRVVSGINSRVQGFPYIVSIRNAATGRHSCGGSIIAANWILTAAHCVADKAAASLSVQFGVTDIAASGPNVVRVRRTIVHEQYAPMRHYANDIALLEVTDSLRFDYVIVAPVQLPAAYFEVAQTEQGELGVLVGWGRNQTYGVAQTTLQKAKLKIYSDLSCYLRHMGMTTTDNLCAGIDAGGKGQCNGDSGGPLIYAGHTQLGIVSWSIKPCAVAPYPGVYTKVSHYVDWIGQHVPKATLAFGQSGSNQC